MVTSALDEHYAAHVAGLFRAFSDTSRVRIMPVGLAGTTESAVYYRMDDPHILTLFKRGSTHIKG